MKTEAVRRRTGTVASEASGNKVSAHADGTMNVTVVYAQRDHVWQAALTVPAGTSVEAVLQLSGFARTFPDYPIETPAVGIFGRRCQLDETVSDADRLEIYRPLSFDPMESRRRRAEHRKTTEKQTPFRPRRVRDAS